MGGSRAEELMRCSNTRNTISSFFPSDMWRQGNFSQSQSGRIFQTQSHVTVKDWKLQQNILREGKLVRLVKTCQFADFLYTDMLNNSKYPDHHLGLSR